MMADKPAFQRRKYFIDRAFQSRFIITFLLVLAFGACLSVTLTWFGWFGGADTLTSNYESGGLVIKKTSLAILPSMVWTTLVTTCILGLAVWIVTLFASHKIAGPMYRFERDLRDIATGNLQKKIGIRDGDQFADMVLSLNAMVDSLNGKLTILNNKLEQLEGKAKELDGPQALIDEIQECRQSLRNEFLL